jgi:hypothetical protein
MLEKQYRESSSQLAFLSSKIETLNIYLSNGEERDRTDIIANLG